VNGRKQAVLPPANAVQKAAVRMLRHHIGVEVHFRFGRAQYASIDN
jgi:hypothetical protein